MILRTDINDMELWEFSEYAEAFMSEADLSSREHRRHLGDLLISAIDRDVADHDFVREIASLLVIS